LSTKTSFPGTSRPRHHAVSAGAERVLAYRPREVDLSEFRGVAEEAGGTCFLRFDDTNPATEDIEYVDAIKEDVTWLGFRWDALYFASDYFERLYGFASI